MLAFPAVKSRALHPRFTRIPPALHPRSTRAPSTTSVHMSAPPAPSLSRHAAYRKRKREGAPVGKRRTLGELAALQTKPLEQRTEEEKEAVRNHRKELKRKERRVAAASAVIAAAPLPVLSAAPPPTRSPSPQRCASSSSAPAILSPLLSPLTVHVAAAAAASSAVAAAQPGLFLVSPPPSSPSPIFDGHFQPFQPVLPAPASPIPPACATSAAAASAMSSASKLKQAILKKRAAEERGRIRTRSVNEEDSQWTAAENTFADSIIATIVKEVRRRKGEQLVGITKERAERIKSNVHSWASAARHQQTCAGAGVSQLHALHGLCPGRFHPATFFHKGAVQFAHWPSHKRNSDPSELIRSRCKSDDNVTFAEWMAVNGRFLYSCCHAIETAQESIR